MKFSALLAVMALAVTVNPVYATEMNTSDDETYAYCNEQAERDGVENMDEKTQYIKDCVESFAIPSGDNPPAGE